jgi:hypothetical protein
MCLLVKDPEQFQFEKISFVSERELDPINLNMLTRAASVLPGDHEASHNTWRLYHRKRIIR